MVSMRELLQVIAERPAPVLMPGTSPSAFADRSGLHAAETSRHIVFWQGTPLWPEASSPSDAIQNFCGFAQAHGIPEARYLLEGIYVLFIYDKDTSSWSVIADNSGLARIFYDHHLVSTSFLALLMEGGYDPEDIDPSAIVEFILQDCIFSGRTPVRGVHFLSRDEQLRLTDQGVTIFAASRPARQAQYDPLCVETFFARHAAMFSSRPYAVDLTGGSDSRVLYALVRKYVKTHRIFVSGALTSPDVRIAQSIARKMCDEIFIADHDISSMDDDIGNIFMDGDGMTDIKRFHRNWQLIKIKKSKSLSATFHGAGGEFFRDAYSLQDFPLYVGRRANATRFYNFRISPINVDKSLLYDTDIIFDITSRSISQLRDINGSTKSEKYDMMFFQFKAPGFFGQLFWNYINMGMDIVAPFFERTNVESAISCPIWQKAFHRWHRSMISKHCAEIASIRTVDGMRLSTDPYTIYLDSFQYLLSFGRRVVRKLAQRSLGRSVLGRGASDVGLAPGFEEAVRLSSWMEEAMAALVRARIFREGANVRDLRSPHLGRALTMGLVVRFLEEMKRARRSSCGE